MATGENKDSSSWMDEALELARQAEAQGDVPVGAVIVDANGQIIGRGFNRREKDQNPLAHAEILAIEDASRNLKSWRLLDCTLIVTLEPCPMCLSASQQARLSEVIYAASDPKGGALSLGYRVHEDTRTNHRFPVRQVDDDRCKSILSEFFKKRRKEKSG